MKTNSSRTNILLVTIFFSVFQSITAQTVVINEVQYKNETSLQSLDGEYYDWVELYNNSSESIDLKGYILKDGLNDNDSLVFGKQILLPGAYLSIFCSGLNSTPKEWHAPFKLSVLEDTVYLFSNKHELIDQVVPQCVPPDHSLSRWPDGAAFHVTKPSPSRSNNNADTVYVNYQYDTLMVNLPSGFYDSTISIELQHQNQNNEIRYTLDGKEVDYDELLYTHELFLSDLSAAENRIANYDRDIADPGNDIPKAQVLRAQVFSYGCPASNEISNIYFIGDNNFTENLPIISIITDPDHLFDEEEGIYISPNYLNRGKAWEREAHIEVFNSSLQTIIKQDAGIRIHGAGSRSAPQKSFKLYAREEYGDTSFSYPFFSQKPHLNEFQELIIKGLRDWTGTMFKAEMCQHLIEDLDIDYSASELVLVFLDGEYWGGYNLRERINDTYIENNYQLPIDSFDIIKYTRTYTGSFDYINELEVDVFGGVELNNGTIDAYYELVKFLHLSDPSSPTFYGEISLMIDINAFIDYLISELFLANVDFIDNNVFFWKSYEEGSLWRPIFYDLDGSMHNIRLDYLSEFRTATEGDNTKPYWSTLIFSKLLRNESFNRRFSTRYNELMSHTFSSQNIINHIDSFYSAYEAIMPLHIYRWDNPTDIVKWQDNVEALYEFAIQRPVEVFKQLDQPAFIPFEIYPNPVKNLLNIEFYDEVDHLELKIISISGQQVLHQNHTSTSHISSPINLEPGMYIAQINVNGFVYTKKLLVIQ